MGTRLVELEERLAHQEAAIDELTRTVLQQQRDMRVLRDRLQRLEQQVRATTGAEVASPHEESPPPHY